MTCGGIIIPAVRAGMMISPGEFLVGSLTRNRGSGVSAVAQRTAQGHACRM